jgi:hypothetical protein
MAAGQSGSPPPPAIAVIGVVFPLAVWTTVTGSASPDALTVVLVLFVCRLVCDRGAQYTRGDRHLPDERATREGQGSARPDHRLVAAGRERGAGHAAAREQPMRIYDGSPRQDFEEVFRSIGAFLDTRGTRDILLLEVPDGFVVQGLVAGGASGGSWSESMGSIGKETLTFSDEDIATFMEEAAVRRGAGTETDPSHAGPYERALRVIGHWMDGQKPKDVFLLEQDGAYVIRLLMAGSTGAHHEIAEFTREDVTGLVASAPMLRGKDASTGS